MVLLGAAGAWTTASAQEAAAPADTTAVYAKANDGPIECYIMLMRLRHDLWARYQETGEWPDDKEANAALDGHVAYWDEQMKQGRVVITGGMGGEFWDNVAMIVFEAASLEEAEQIAATDPAVKAYVFKVQVRPFTVHGITNKYSLDVGEGTGSK